MKKKILYALSIVTLVVAIPLAAQFGVDNTSVGASGHIDLPSSGTCSAGPSNAIRICAGGSALYFSLGGGTPYTPDMPITISGSLTNAQILGMYAAPVTVVSAQGAGTLIEVLGYTLENVNTGTAYANGGAISLDLNNAGTVTVGSATVAASFLTSPTTTQTITAMGGQASATKANTVNMPLAITNASAAFITGTGTMNYWVTYRVRSGF